MTRWVSAPLGDVCSFINRGVAPKYIESGGMLVLNQRCIRDHAISTTVARRHDVGAKRVPEERLVRLGDVLVNSTGEGTLGRVALVRTEPQESTTVDSHVTIVRPRPRKFFDDFFGYMLQDIEPVLMKSGVGSGGQTELNRTALAEMFLVRFPESLAEQQRIVGVLDEALAAIATARADAEQNLHDARELFASYLRSVFAEAWRTSRLVTLSDLASDITDGDHMPPPKSRNGVPFVTIGNIVKATGRIDFSDTFMVPRDYFDALKEGRKPKKGDVLYTVTGWSLGIPVHVDESVEFCFQRHIGLVRPKPGINSMWLYYLLQSPQVYRQADRGATGAAQRTVSLGLLRSLEVPSVDSAKQTAVVAVLNTIWSETERLASVYQRKLAALDALKQSLLHQAFTGAL